MHAFYKACILVSVFILAALNATPHAMPNSLIQLSVQDRQLEVDLLLPLAELELAFGKPLQAEPFIIQKYRNELGSYILHHFRIYNDKQLKPWPMRIITLEADPLVNGDATSYFRELSVALVVDVPDDAGPREFMLDYDVIIHQVVTHFAVVKVVRDFKAGIVTQQPLELGLIQLDIKNNFIPPFKVDLENGSNFNGLRRFFLLGCDHILSGTDHLLFLLMLLLVTPLIAIQKKWSLDRTTINTLFRVLRIVTAFTLGHSLTLFITAFAEISQFTRSIEVLIAVSIFVSAIHVLRPLFPGRETFIAFGFGLIHGMAFGNSIKDLHLEPYWHVLSVLGFNLGIEIVQLGIVALVIPVLMNSKEKYFHPVRLVGGLTGCVVSIAWIAERISGSENAMSHIVNRIHF